MSQSATLYRITKENFHKIEKREARHVIPSEITEGDVTFQGTFMGLEAILSKCVKDFDRELIFEIFNPSQYIGPTDSNIFNLDSDEDEQFSEIESAVGYLPPSRVKKISSLLNNIEESLVSNNYNSEELNADGIYPGCWQDDDEAGNVFNKRQILEDFALLKGVFQAAFQQENYILSYVG
jgi:hypothetical protein